MSLWLKQHAGEPIPHAIFAANDNIAIGCHEALSAFGIRVPEDISVAGFDDTLTSRMTMPALTTVRQPLHLMGQEAVEVLISQIRSPGKIPAGSAANPIVFPVELMQRASTSRPAARGRVVPRLYRER
jgi:LacI family transcriptional regulator